MKGEMTNGQIVVTGGGGVAASFAAWWSAHVQLVNGTLQTGCLALGFVVSLVTLWRLVAKRKK